MDQSELIGLARALAQTAGRAEPERLERLTGGRNNRVFLAVDREGAPSVLKVYFRDPRDPRDRLRAEHDFLAYAAGRDITSVPRVLAADHEAGAALLSFITGDRLVPGMINPAHVAVAADLIVALNDPAPEPDALAPASEACLTLADHVATVARRVARLASLDPATPGAEDAARFIEHELAPAWASVAARLARLDDTQPARACVSPSDFGFHNALTEGSGAISFLDFEYAGMDDPAKLICDFFCQPQVPVPLDHFAAFATRVSPRSIPRATALLDAYRIKWICIMLNEFLPTGAARRDFSQADARAGRALSQLEAARAALAVLGHTPET